jgi:hypothetical protein
MLRLKWNTCVLWRLETALVKERTVPINKFRIVMLWPIPSFALDLCRGCLKYGSSVRVPDSGNRINSTQIVAKYDELEGFYLRGYTEVGDPVLASIVEIHKSSRNDLPSRPRISRYIYSGNMIRPPIKYLKMYRKRGSSSLRGG